MSSGGRAGADTPPAFMRLITIKQLLLEVNMLIQNYFENPAVIRIGALPACSYFIPADNAGVFGALSQPERALAFRFL